MAAEGEHPARLDSLTEARTAVATWRSFTAATGVREDRKLTLILPTQSTADGIEVGTERQSLHPCQTPQDPLPTRAIWVYLDLFASSPATFSQVRRFICSRSKVSPSLLLLVSEPSHTRPFMIICSHQSSHQPRRLIFQAPDVSLGMRKHCVHAPPRAALHLFW